MSWQAVDAVLEHSASHGAERLVLIVIAERADARGEGCWRGKESIAERANLSRSRVTTAVTTLRQLGELDVVSRPGRTNLYRVLMPSLVEIAEGADDAARRVADPGQTGSQVAGQTGSRDPSSETSIALANLHQLYTEEANGQRRLPVAAVAPPEKFRGSDSVAALRSAHRKDRLAAARRAAGE